MCSLTIMSMNGTAVDDAQVIKSKQIARCNFGYTSSEKDNALAHLF